MIDRPYHRRALAGLLRRHPAVGIIGARQIGKTTLARQLAEEHRGPVTFFDLEDAADTARLAEPLLTLRPLRGLVVIDEVQGRPDLFAALRVLADRPRLPARFLVLGSASPELQHRAAETLAGRIAYHELRGLDLEEVGASRWERLWLRGGFPRAYVASSGAASAEWRRAFVRTFLERDLPRLGVQIPVGTLHRFWQMLAHYHGQIWNGSELGRAFGVSDTTVRRYVDVLAATFVVRTLLPWSENLGKRQVKAPKVYLADPGLLHTLLGITSQRDLEGHPKVGASFEGFALEQVIARLGARPEECFFWATHAGAELDLLVVRGNRRVGFEFKRTERPQMTRSLGVALADLRLERAFVIHAGEHRFPLAERVEAIPVSRILDDLGGIL